MIRVAQLTQSIDARGGGTTTALLRTLDSIETRDGRFLSTTYTVRPPAQDPIWATVRRAPERFMLTEAQGGLLPGPLGRTIAKDLLDRKIDLLHVHGVWSQDLVMGVRAAKRAGIPVLWQPHGMLLRSSMQRRRLKKQVFLRLGLNRALRSADGFIAPSQLELDDSVIPNSCPPERRFHVGYPILLPDAAPEWAPEGRAHFGLAPDAFVFAFLGRLHPVKRVEMTIEAFVQATAAAGGDGGPPPLGAASRLLILGQGEPAYERMLRDRVSALKLTDRVIFSGWLDNPTKLRGLAASDSLVLNSTLESFGYVLFEALGVGTPAVVTSNLTMADDFHQRGAGLRAENSVAGLARGMRTMATLSTEQRAEMARKGLAWARQDYSLEATGRRLDETYMHVLDRRPR